LFPVLKDYLAGRHYNDRSSLGSSIYQCLNSMSEDDYTAAIRKLPERWQKCIWQRDDTSKRNTYINNCNVFCCFIMKAVWELF
jgi:hypothetical protein